MTDRSTWRRLGRTALPIVALLVFATFVGLIMLVTIGACSQAAVTTTGAPCGGKLQRPKGAMVGTCVLCGRDAFVTPRHA